MLLYYNEKENKIKTTLPKVVVFTGTSLPDLAQTDARLGAMEGSVRGEHQDEDLPLALSNTGGDEA